MTVRCRSVWALAVWLLCLPFAALAQTGYWVQVEAHATLRTAEDFAARYEARVGSVSGFRIAGGWYALAIGPYETPEDAESVRARLLAAREIRADAYVTDGTIYGAQFWPAGATGAERTTIQTSPAPVAEPEPEPPVVEAPVVEAPVVQAPVVEAPVAVAPTPEPEETLADARARDRELTRDQREAIQTALAWFGFYTTRIDAAFGPGTRRAIEGWQGANGFEPTGFLTGRQLDDLLGSHEAALARFDFRTVRDETAGIEISLPMGMVAFDRHESPFAHFASAGGSEVRVLLISQEGTQATLFGLYEIMQTLTVIPTEGARERRSNGFLLTGQNDTLRAHAEARLDQGRIKGWVLLWTAAADADAPLILSTMQSTFRAIDGVLPDTAGNAGLAVARRDLVAGLEVRRPIRGRSGFFVDAVGSVVTAAEAVQGCERVTIDQAYTARVQLLDEGLGLAVLTPVEPLVPLAFAQFAGQVPGVGSDLRLSGYSFEDTLSRPILTFGQLAGEFGLYGEEWQHRLTLAAQPGDVGGPVFDPAGAVMGMLLPRADTPDRQFPPDVSFAVSAAAIQEALGRAGLRGALSRDNAAMPAETLTRVSADMTVLVSCWN